MHILFSLIALSAFAAPPRVVTGVDSSGAPCALVIEQASGLESWGTIALTVRTSWQRIENASLVAKQSFTPYHLYGLNKATKDQISIEFAPSQVPSLDAIQNFLFEARNQDQGHLQTYCRIAK